MKREVVSMGGIADWTAQAGARLGIDAGQASTALVIELAREVSRAEGRHTAVMAAYLLGVAVGRGVDPREAAARLADLTEERSGTACDWRD
ncbi:DUF6457 domain-containing protein [Actinophytocola sp.]|uniref:DUF6457 domain-containing protein n=1 Tax=Actinophytocola sp. TaxID=1872138 RepID=UPI00389A9270